MIEKVSIHERRLSRVVFGEDNLFLELIALKIIWGNNRSLWRTFLSSRFPVFSTIRNWNTRTIKSLLAKIYKEKEREIDKSSQQFREWWFPVEKEWFSLLEDVFELRTGMSLFKANIGISPISPRNLGEESFLVPFYADRKKLIRLCAHETSHFYFYRKISEIIFDIQSNENQLWLISEILVPLLFSDPRAVNILGQMPQGSYICKQSLIERCREIYERRSKREITFQELLECLLRVEIKAGELNEKFFFAKDPMYWF